MNAIALAFRLACSNRLQVPCYRRLHHWFPISKEFSPHLRRCVRCFYPDMVVRASVTQSLSAIYLEWWPLVGRFSRRSRELQKGQASGMVFEASRWLQRVRKVHSSHRRLGRGVSERCASMHHKGNCWRCTELGKTARSSWALGSYRFLCTPWQPTRSQCTRVQMRAVSVEWPGCLEIACR